MKAPVSQFLVLSLDGDTGATGPGWEAPGEGLPLAGCGRSFFPGHPAVGSAHHCPGCAGLDAPGSGTTGEWLQQAPEGCILWTVIDLCAFASLAQLVALTRGHVWSVSACSPCSPTLMFQAPSWLRSLPDTQCLSCCPRTYVLFALPSSKMHAWQGAGGSSRAGLYAGRCGAAMS